MTQESYSYIIFYTAVTQDNRQSIGRQQVTIGSNLLDKTDKNLVLLTSLEQLIKDDNNFKCVITTNIVELR